MPNLDINIIPTYNKRTIGIGDNSSYEKTPSSPTLEVNVPGFTRKSIVFTPGSLMVLNSNTLGMTEDLVETAILPDGIWVIKYSVVPNYENYTTITFLKTDLLEEKYAEAFLALDLNQCENDPDKTCLSQLKELSIYLEGAKAAARVCNNSLAMKLYNLVNKKLDKFLKNGMQYC